MAFQRMLRAKGRRCRTAWAVAGAALVLALGLSRDAWSQTKTWTAGGITVTWDDAGNWSPAGVPTALDRVVFPLGSFGPTGPYPTITLGASSVANSLVLDNNYTLSGGALTLTTGSIYADLGVYAAMSSTLSGSAGFTKQGGGAIRLSNNANNYTGTTNIADGVLVITGQGALGSSSSTVRITDQNFVPNDLNVQGYGGGALFLDARTSDFSVSRNIDAVGYGPTGGRGGAIIALGNATLTGNVVSSTTSLTPATLRTTRFISSDGMLTFSGTLNVLGTAFTTFTQLGTNNQAGAGSYTLSGGLEGTGSLEKTGVGTLFLAPVTTASFSGAIRAGTSVANGVSQSTIRITSSNVLGTRIATGSNAVLDLNGGTVEVRMDSPSLLAGGSAANAYIRLPGTSHTPLFVDHAAGSAALSGTLTLGRLDYDEGTGTLTLLSRNGYSLDAGTALSVGGNDGPTTFGNSIAGLLTFSGTAFWNMANSTSRTMTISGNGNTLITTNVIASNTTAGIDHVLTKSGAGLLTITGTASTLDGAVNVQGGALAITDFRSVTNNSGTITLGNSTTGGSLIFGTTVAPTAAGLTGTNKVINLAGTTGGGNIYANQSGANPVIINFLTSGSGSKTLTLGGTSVANNVVNAGIADGTSPSVTSVTKVGPGTWVFSGTNTYTGTTTISDGTLRLNANGASSTVLSSTSAITFNAANGYAGGTLEFAGQAATTNVQTLGTLTPNQGGNTIRVTPGAGGSASLSFSNLVTSAGSGLNIVGADATTNTVSFLAINGGAGSTGLVTRNVYWNGADFAYRNASTGILRAPVYGTDATFSTAGAGTATLTASANNDVTGDITAQTTLSVVTVRMSGNRTLTLNSGQTLTLTGAGLLGTSGTSLLTGGTLALGSQTLVARVNLADDVLQVASLMTGSGGLTKNGAGTLVLSSTANAQTNTITINEGTIRLSGSGARLGAAASLVIRDGATLDLNGVTPGTNTNQFDNMGTVTSASAATFTVGGSNGTGTSYGIVSGLVNVTKLGTGGQSWLGLSTYTGTTAIGSTGLVTVDVLADIGVASGIGRGDATSNATNAASLVFNGSTGGLVYAGNLRPLGSGDPSIALGSTSASTNRLFTLAGTGARLSSTVSNNNAIVWSNTGAIVHGIVGPQAIAFEGTSVGDNTFTPQITDAGTGANITSVTKAGAGQWNLAGLNNTYSGSTTINEGIFAINAAGALPSTSPLVLAPTSASSVAVFQASGTITRALASSAVAGSHSVTFTGTTASTTGGVGFAAHGSRLVVALGGTASPTALTWGSGGFVGTGTTQNLVLNSVSSLAEIDFRNPIDLGSAARVVNVQDNTTTGADYAIMSGSLSGAGGGSLRKIGNGILQLTGASTYTGTTSVEAGALAVRSFGSSSDAPNTPTSVGVSGVAMGDANALTLGNGSTTAANLFYAGAGETSDRKIRLNTTTAGAFLFADGSGPLVLTNVANDMQAGAKILYLRGSSPVPNMITGTLTDSTSGTGGALSVNIDGGGAIWILTGSNSYTGVTTVNAPIGLGHDFAMGSGTASIQNGSSVFAFGGDRTVSTRVSLSGGSTSGFYGDYNLTLTNVSIAVTTNNNNVFNNIAAGRALTLVNPVTGDMTANRTWQVNGNGTTIVTGSLTVSAGSGANGLLISKNGDGTLVLGGTGNNFNRNGAAIDVDRGTLRMGSDNAIRAQAGDGGLTLTPEVATFDAATFDLNGTQQTINAVTATTDGTIVIDNSSTTAASLTFGANDSAVALFTAGTGTYSIANSGAGALSIIKTGSTAFTMLPGVTLQHKGTTGVTGGSMTIPAALAATTGLAVSGSNSLLALTGGITNPGLITNVSVGAGATLSLLDGVGNSMTNLTALSFGGGGSGATTLRMNFGDSGSDTLGLVGGTLSLDPASTVTFFLTDIGASGNTRYDLVTSSTGGLSAGTYALGSTPGGFSTFSLVTTDTAVYALSGSLITGSSFWTGSLGTAWNSGTANWSTDKAGTTPALSIPGSGSDVVFVADTVTTTGTLATTLEQNFRINSLTLQSGTGGTPSAVTIGPGTPATNRLEIAPQASLIGISMAAGGPASATISSPLKVGADQTWNVASGTQTLTVSGPLFGEAAVTKSGAGTVVISGTADATFNSGTTTVFTVAAGNLSVTNAAALGSAANSNLARINVSGGAFYYDNATAGTLPNAITLSGGTLSAANNAHTYSGAISLTAPSTINMRNANADTSGTTTRNITLSGGLTGAGVITVLSSTTLASGNPSSSSLTLSTNNSGWSGGLDLRQGMVVLSNTGALGTGPITASGGKLNFNTAGGTTFALGQNVSLTSSNAILEIAADASGTPVSDMTVNLSGTFTLGSASSGTTALRLNPATDNFSVLNITGPVILGNHASISTVNSTTRPATISGPISDGGGNYSLVVNDNFGGWGQTSQTLVLTGSNTYGGGTVITSGTLRIGATDTLPTTGAVRIGVTTTAGALDLASFSQTIGSLSVASTATGVTNRILIPTGQTLTVNGSVLFGVDANGATTRLTGTGGGAFVVSSSNSNFVLGGAAGGTNDNAVYVDFSGLSVFNASLGSGTFRMGDNNTGTDSNPTAFTLATSNTITAGSFGVGTITGGGYSHILTLGSGGNVINANTVSVGQTGSGRSNGQIVFAAGDTTGTVRIRGSNGESRATVNMVNSPATTANTLTATMDFTAHAADILSGTWTMASRSATTAGGATATLSFDQGTFDITTLKMAERTGGGTGPATATVNLGGGTSTIGALAMAVNTSAGGTSTATFNVTGGSVTIGAGSGTAVNMATAAASRTSISTLNLTGGTVTLAGNIVRSGSGGTETATITLNGARLDLGGFAIGSSSAPITLDAQSGSLGNLGQLNGGAILAKTSTGTLTLFGSSSFGGGLAVNAGTLDLGGFSPTVGLLTGSSSATITSNGAGPSTLTVSSTGSGTYAGVIQDGSAVVGLTKAGPGTLTLAGANTYSGTTTVSVGALAISTTAALPGIADAGRYAVIAGAALAVGNAVDDATFQSMLATGNFAAASYAGFDTSAGDRTYATASTGTMGLAKIGSNTLNITGSNSFSGGTLIAGGTLNLGTGGSVTGAIVNQGVLAFDRADPVTLSGPISGTGGLLQSSTVAAGVVTLAGTNSYTGETIVKSGTVVVLGDNSAATGGWYLPTTSAPFLNKAVTFAAGSVVVTASDGRVQLGDLSTGNVTSSALTVLGAATNSGSLILGRFSTFTIGSGGTWLQSGSMQLSPQGGYNVSMNVNAGGLFTYTGTSTIKLNPSVNNTGKSTVTIAGGTFVTSAGFEQIVSSGTYSGSPTLALSNSGVLRISQDIPALTTISTGSGNLLSMTLGSGGGTIDTNGFSTTIGVAISGAGGLTKAGAGTLTLSGSNAYSGGTWLTAGTLVTSHTVAFGSGAITIAAGGTLDLNNLQIGNTITNDGGTVLNAGSYTGSQTVATGTATLAGGVAGLLDVSAGAVAEITGPLAASGTVSVASGGLGRASGELLGRVSVGAAGTFEIINGGSVGPAAVMQNAGTLRIDRTQFLEIATVISGSGGLEKTGSGKLVLTGQNTYTGQTAVLAGQLAVNGALAGGLTVALGAEVGGSGMIGGLLTGNGVISPGNSPGILTAPQLAPTGTTSFNFEFSGTGSPAWNTASNSINDVLRLTDATTPITSSLVGTNVVNVYFNVASLSVGEVFLGGFFTDRQAAFDSLIGNATYQFFVKGDGNGGTLYNDVNYYALSSWAGANVPGFAGVTRATVQATANFTGGTVNGQVTQFVIVPEPGTAAAASIGIGIAAWMLRRRRMIRAGRALGLDSASSHPPSMPDAVTVRLRACSNPFAASPTFQPSKNRSLRCGVSREPTRNR